MTADRGNAVNYLLGLMAEEERERVRDQLLSDPAEFERLREVENDLFDAYAAGTLEPRLRDAFERTLLRQPGGAAKLRFASAWRMRTKAPARRRAPWVWMCAAAAALLVGLFWRPLPPASGGGAGRSGNNPVASAPAAAPQTIHLAAVTRSGPVPKVRLQPEAPAIEFRAPVPAGMPLAVYDVTLSRGGNEVWSGRARRDAGELVWRTTGLNPGAYEIRIGPAADPLAYFEVILD